MLFNGLGHSCVVKKQRVKINGCYSEWADVISGIPQGTILGPVLFIIYINDLPEICEQFARIYLFADDAKLFKQLGLNALQDWSNKWISLNVKQFPLDET